MRGVERDESLDHVSHSWRCCLHFEDFWRWIMGLLGIYWGFRRKGCVMICMDWYEMESLL
jgi:hypothetical protein